MSKVTPIGINRQKIEWLIEQPIDVQLSVATHHMQIVQLVLNSIMEGEVASLTGGKYSRDKPHAGRYDRWGSNPGSIKVGGEKIRMEVPRVHDKRGGSSVSLSTYKALKDLPGQDWEVMKQVLHGISTRDYKKVSDCLLDSFGNSAASVSRQFQEGSEAALREFEERKYGGHNFVALFIDGKQVAGDQMVIVVGVTDTGKKIPLGVVQTHSENAASLAGLLRDIVSRGLRYGDGLLYVVDGSKGFRKAVKEVFGDAAVIQRCQWHKRENVVSYLSEGDREKYRRKMQNAYNRDTYEGAKEELASIHDELQVLNRAAAKSLQEGLEETLTLHRLGLFTDLGRSFKTTNCIENVNSCLGKYIGRVKNWSSSQMRYRWVCSALMEIEPKLRKVNNYKKLPKMMAALKREVERIKLEKNQKNNS
jgi:transposase-like protein